MRVNIYRRENRGDNLSYLAVPEGKPIPDEATNIDWESEASGIELDEASDQWPQFSIEHPLQQIQEKGYAITSVLKASGTRETAPADSRASA